MSEEQFRNSVSLWIEELKDGKHTAQQEVWNRYFDRLIRLVQRRFGDAPRRVADEEDIAVSVFDSIYDGAANGRFDKLKNRDDLWKLLVAISSMKITDQIRRQTAKKRGGTDVRGESILVDKNADEVGGFDRFLAIDPTPDFLLIMDEQRDVLFEALPDESQRLVAKHRLDGYTNEEIVERTGISLRSVERKLKVVRDTWSRILNNS